MAAAIKQDRSISLESCRDTAAQIKPGLMREPIQRTLQHFYTIPLYTKAVGEWTILTESAPPRNLLILRSLAYARIALLRRKPDESARELESLTNTKDPLSPNCHFD